MKKSLKLFTVMIVLCFLALPAASFAAYDSLYANAADSIFTDNSWTGMEENTVSGADYSYHVWYDVGGVRADYYMASYDTYTTEWLTYDGTAGDESWLYTAAADGSYQVAQENFDYTDYDLSYSLYDDGSSYMMEYDFNSVDGAFTGWYDYSVDIETQASGYYLYDYSYSSHNLSWDYSLENDVSNAQYYEDKYWYDPINGQRSEEHNWKSTATGSYDNYAYTAMGTATSTGTGSGSWSWDYSERTWNYSTFSADYSSFWSSYQRNTYSDAGDTYWYQWDGKITDSGYYLKGWDWENNIDGSGESYYESFGTSSGTNILSKYYDKYDDVSEYYSSYYEYTDSGKYGLAEDYSYSDGYDLSYSRYEYSDPSVGEMRTSYDYTWTQANLYYYTYGYNYTNDITGYQDYYSNVQSRDGTGQPYYYWGSGTQNIVAYGYTPEIQQNWYYEYDYTYAAGASNRRTDEYYYSETSLADSDQQSKYWYEYTYDPDTGSQLTYSNYGYYLYSDTGEEYWYYNFNNYEPANYTYYHEDHDKNIYVAGVYEDSVTYRVNGVSYYMKDEGQDLDYYWQSTESDVVGSYSSSSDYELNLASGAQYWDAAYRNSSLGTWSHATLANLNGTAWIGDRTVYDGSAYDLYYYSAYPDDYFLAADQSYIPGIMPGSPGFYY